MTTVVLEKVSRIFVGGVVGVRDLSLSVRDGELLALVGPSGSGKTTTLRLIAGLDRPSAGEVALGGHSMAGVPPWKRNVGLVFQHDALVPHWSVRDNVAGPRWRDERNKRNDDRVASRGTQVEEIARRLGIEKLLDRRPHELSGGERRRAAIARALVRRPAVLLLDEPFAGLDAELTERLRVELVGLQRELGMTTILVTHDQAQALSAGNRVAVMEAGRIEQVDSPEAVYRKPANLTVARRVGEPPMNLWTGRVEHAEGKAVWRSGNWSVEPPGDVVASAAQRPASELVYGVRPTDVTIEPARPRVADAPQRVSVPVKLTRVEFRGDWSAVYGLIQGEEELPIVGRGGPAEKWTFGETARVQWEKDKGHWFEARGGGRLGK
jgi:ABC-type sugar transport system ATPase subunit